MKLDRYTTGIPRFRVFRLDGGCVPGARLQPSGVAVPVDPPLIADKDGNAYTEVDPWECFVFKRRDMYVPMGLFGYMAEAWKAGDEETAGQMAQLIRDWHEKTEQLGDVKTPD